MTKFWIAIASANHVARGRSDGFMQVNHGKAAPLRRIKPQDIVAYYSPVKEFGGTEKLRAFTAIGTVKEGEPYQGDMGPDFKPFRRDVTWLNSTEAAIEPLLATLEFTKGKTNWGYQMRFGLFEVSERDMKLIATRMGVALP